MLYRKKLISHNRKSRKCFLKSRKIQETNKKNKNLDWLNKTWIVPRNINKNSNKEK